MKIPDLRRLTLRYPEEQHTTSGPWGEDSIVKNNLEFITRKDPCLELQIQRDRVRVPEIDVFWSNDKTTPLITNRELAGIL